MSDSTDKPLNPTAFSPQTDTVNESTDRRQRPAWLVPGILTLGVVAVCVFVVLPLLVGDPSTPETQSSMSPTTDSSASESVGSAASAQAPVERSPFAEAQRQQARKAAQDALQRVLELQEILQDLGVERWALDTYQAAIATAMSGDEAYRNGDFTEAATAYLDAGDALVTLEDSVPARIAEARAATLNAIEEGNPLDANASLDLLVLLSPNDLDRDPLRARVAVIPEVSEALDLAIEAADQNDLSAAIDATKRAVSADPDHQRASDMLATYQQQDADQRFRQAMTRGYDLLDQENFEGAAAAFQKARQLRPTSAEVQAAETELSEAKTDATLRALAQTGEQKERAEDWQGALDTYEEALATDPTLVFAQQGLDRVKPRAELATALQTILDEQERLVDRRVLAEAEATLQQAQAISAPGPVLSGQIQAISAALNYARTPVEVNVTSDGQTDVTLLRVRRLGAFSEQNLTLRPGDYVAMGVRTGFRDVRVSFSLKPGQKGAVDVRCTESI